MKKLPLLMFFLAMPSVYADCSLANLGACLPEAIFDFFLGIINQPLGFLLNLVNQLLTEPVNLETFYYFWIIIVYIISIFYALMFIYAGYNFIISGYDFLRRERAKLFLRDTIIMVVAVNASFFFYNLLLEISGLMSAGVINMIDSDFFTLTADNFANVGLEFVFVLFYLITLLITLVLFALRYILVGWGLLLFPLGVFFYFVPFLNSYGKLILNLIIVVVFLPFFSSLILLMGSLLLNLEIFADIKILVMIASFGLVNLSLIFLLVFAVVKSAFGIIKGF